VRFLRLFFWGSDPARHTCGKHLQEGYILKNLYHRLARKFEYIIADDIDTRRYIVPMRVRERLQHKKRFELYKTIFALHSKSDSCLIYDICYNNKPPVRVLLQSSSRLVQLLDQ